MTPHITLVCVGTELLRGKINTHASDIALALQKIGLSLGSESTTRDDPSEMRLTFSQAFQRSDVLLVTGGLGPTFDDITREIISEIAGRALVRNSGIVRWLKAHFRKARVPFSKTVLREADILQGARVLINHAGTAPGQILEIPTGNRQLAIGNTADCPLPTARIIVLLPGPAREMRPMLEKQVLPFLKNRFVRGAVETREYHWAGVPESEVDQRLRPLISSCHPERSEGSKSQILRSAQNDSNVSLDYTILAGLGLVDFYITSRGNSRAKLIRALVQFDRQIPRSLRKQLYSTHCRGLTYEVGKLLTQRKQTVSVAESCTGGGVGEHLTQVPGSSRYFLGGVIPYSNTMKEQLLGVDGRILKKEGAVSESVAKQMALGAQDRFGSDWAVSVTGVSGPGGGTVDKPVGTVWIAVAGPSSRAFGKQAGLRGKIVAVRRYPFSGERAAVRERSINKALQFLWENLRSGNLKNV